MRFFTLTGVICAVIVSTGCARTDSKTAEFYSLDPSTRAKVWFRSDEIISGASFGAMAAHCGTLNLSDVAYTTANCLNETSDGGLEGTIQLQSDHLLSYTDMSNVTVAMVFDWMYTPGALAPNAGLFSSGDVVVNWQSGQSLYIFYATRTFHVNADVPDGKTSVVYTFTQAKGAKVWINGVPQTVIEDGIYTTTYGTGYMEFGIGGGNDFQGKLYDIVVLDHLPETEVDGLNCYIYQKHGIVPRKSCFR